MRTLLLFITIVFCAKENGSNQYTKIYQSLMGSLFLRETYLSHDKCRIVNNREEYLQILGRYDISSQDYHMEHIIDKNGSPYPQNKNILGNIIMSKADWNRQVGQLNWQMVEKEKRRVYGDEIFESALQAVINCNLPNVIESIDADIEENEVNEVNEVKIRIPFLIILLILSILSLFIIGSYIFYDLNREAENLTRETIVESIV